MNVSDRLVISSHSTLVYKSLVPVLFVTLSVFLITNLFYGASPHDLGAMIGTLMMIGVTAFFCWFGTRLKQVGVDEHYLYVAGFFKEISIPITAIDSIGGFHNGSPVTLRLKEESEFGRTILFVAKWRPVLPWEAHPIFGQLGQLIRKNQVGN